MKDNKLPLILVLISLLVQLILMIKLNTNEMMFTFATGINFTRNSIKIFIPLLFLLLPNIMSVFLFGESGHRIKQGYGTMYVIRNYSKKNLVLKDIIKSYMVFCIIMLLQILLYYAFKDHFAYVSKDMILKSLVLYFLVNTAIITFEYLLGLCVNYQFVNLITSLFIFLSCCMGYLSQSMIVRILLFPSLMLGKINGATSYGILYYENLIIAIVINIILVILVRCKFEKSDIF